MRNLRFLAGVGIGLLFGWVPPELIAWLRDGSDYSTRDDRQRRVGKRRRGRRIDRRRRRIVVPNATE